MSLNGTAYQPQAKGLFTEPRGTFAGVPYPSCRNRGKQAVARASTYVDDARGTIIHSGNAFKQTPEYRQLLGDPFRIDKP